jgi:hypothetical protein
MATSKDTRKKSTSPKKKATKKTGASAKPKQKKNTGSAATKKKQTKTANGSGKTTNTNRSTKAAGQDANKVAEAGTPKDTDGSFDYESRLRLIRQRHSVMQSDLEGFIQEVEAGSPVEDEENGEEADDQKEDEG